MGLGARITDDYEPLFRLIKDEVKIKYPFVLKGFHPGLIFKVLRFEDKYMTVLVNKGDGDLSVEVETVLKPVRIVYPAKTGLKNSKTLVIPPEATFVIEWQ